MNLPEGIRLEVESPATGRRCPAWLDGRTVCAACGAISQAAPVFVVFEPPAISDGAGDFAQTLRRYGWEYAVVDPKRKKARAAK
jgi:hypothetical protein